MRASVCMRVRVRVRVRVCVCVPCACVCVRARAAFWPRCPAGAPPRMGPNSATMRAASPKSKPAAASPASAASWSSPTPRDAARYDPHASRAVSAIVGAHEFLDLYQHTDPRTRWAGRAFSRWQHAPRAQLLAPPRPACARPAPLDEASASSSTRLTTPSPWLLTCWSAHPGVTTVARAPRRLARRTAAHRPGWSPLDLVPPRPPPLQRSVGPPPRARRICVAPTGWHRLLPASHVLQDFSEKRGYAIVYVDRSVPRGLPCFPCDHLIRP